mmetsp:Transcript_1597/g.3659  ORF Transcript_1597/g.3659 Transcript_1597/m.3659 type:complete len:238 (-) Transcript_1597:602-1315(-)
MMRCRQALEFVASFPPLSRRPLPDRIARDAIWGRASGRASKMMRQTPMGAVTLSRTRPSAISIALRGFRMGSSCCAIARTPTASCLIFSGLSLSLCMSAASMPAFSPSSTSLALAAMISSSAASSALATRSRTACRELVGSACNCRLAFRAAIAVARASAALAPPAEPSAAAAGAAIRVPAPCPAATCRIPSATASSTTTTGVPDCCRLSAPARASSEIVPPAATMMRSSAEAAFAI